MIEETNEIERDFIESWINIKKFYDEHMRGFLGTKLVALMIQFIEQMEAAGYNKHLRAGQSMHELILSRSREHGYLGRYYICFSPPYRSIVINDQEKTYQLLQVKYSVDGALASEFEEEEIALTDRIQEVLRNLSKQPISYLQGLQQ